MARTGEPDKFFNFRGKIVKSKLILGIFSRFERFSTIKILFLAKILCTGNSLLFPISILGESIPTKFIFFETKYSAADIDKPGLFKK